MATLRQIAEEAGVSANTVSRVLNGKTKNVWPSMALRAARIRQIATRLNYRPSGAARAMREGRTHTIALLLSSESRRSFVPPRLWRGLLEAVRQRDLHLTVGDLPDEKLTSEGYVPRILRELSADGLLINYTHEIPQRMRTLIEDHQVPSIWMNAKLPADCVYPDELDGGRRATEHLLGLGHRRIAFVSFNSPVQVHYSTGKRIDGYRQAMRDASLRPQIVSGQDGSYEEASSQWRRESCRLLLAADDRPSAVIARGDEEASTVLYAAARAGLDVPDDLSILVFNAGPYERAGLQFDTMVIPAERMGAMAVEMLMMRCRETVGALPPKALALYLERGQTCAAAPSGHGP